MTIIWRIDVEGHPDAHSYGCAYCPKHLDFPKDTPLAIVEEVLGQHFGAHVTDEAKQIMALEQSR